MTFQLEQMPNLRLNDGKTMPQLGLGVYKMTQDVAVPAVLKALELGYRRIDTAALYDNELEVGAAIRKSGLEREEVFVTTKIWNDRQGYDDALEAIDESLDRLNIGYIDMMLIHWPCPAQDRYVDTWKAFEHALGKGRIRSIGVSNFHPHHLDRLIGMAEVVPAINQVELHPCLQQAEVRAYNSAHSILTEAWSPIMRGTLGDEPTLVAIAAAHAKTVTQVILRWHVQLGNLVIPKSVNPDRLAENLDVFNFTLNESEMQQIALLDTGLRTGPNPDEF